MPKRNSVFRKRRFCGNQHCNKIKPCDSHVSESTNSVESDVQYVTPDSKRDTPPTSASKFKLGEQYKELGEFNENLVSNLGYVIVDLNILSQVLGDFLCCNLCGGQVNVEEDTSARNGLAAKIIINCTNCKSRKSIFTSKQCKNNLHEVNIRLFYAMRAIGKGLSAAQIFCALMNLPPPPARIQKYSGVIGEAVQSIASSSMRAAANEAVELNEGSKDIPIAFDGTWQKRGHTSKNSVATVTSIDTGKVIDFEALTKHCYACCEGNTNGEHKTNCQKNYEGTSGGMEAAAAVNIFSRSQQERDVRYTQFLGDGDSKAYKCVIESKPYGDVKIKKVECVGHVQKRMGTRLRKLKQTLRTTVLSDGKLLRGRLTDKTINELQQYYGMAIRNNTNNLESMKKAVWATYFHKLSNDRQPVHSLCPPGPETWCKFRKAEASGESFEHKNSIPEAVMEAIKPTYKDLAHPDLLSKCLHGRTQNPNESFNNIIWTRVPKNVFVGIKTLKWGVNDAVLTFNDGNMGRIRVLMYLNIVPGIHTVKGLQLLDKLRIAKGQRAAEFSTKEARSNRRKRLLEKEEDKEEDPDYSAGCY